MFGWDNTFSGFKIVVRPHHERVHVADEVYSYRWHPFWQWLARMMRRPAPLTIERGRPILDDGPMLVIGNTIYCSPRQHQELNRAIAAQH